MFDPQKLMEMMKQASEMQKKMQEELGSKRVYGSAGGGMVNVVMNGQFEVCDLKIDPSVVSAGDVEFLEDLIRAGINDATKNARDLMTEQMKSMTSKLGLPFG